MCINMQNVKKHHVCVTESSFYLLGLQTTVKWRFLFSSPQNFQISILTFELSMHYWNWQG
jgi:hypothetical protein